MKQWISALQGTKNLTVIIFYLNFKSKYFSLKLNWTSSKILSTIPSTSAWAEERAKGIEVIEEKRRDKLPSLHKKGHIPTRHQQRSTSEAHSLPFPVLAILDLPRKTICNELNNFYTSPTKAFTSYQSIHCSFQNIDTNIFPTKLGKNSGRLGTVTTQNTILLVGTCPSIHPCFNSMKFKRKRGNNKENTVKILFYAFISIGGSKHFCRRFQRLQKEEKVA